jgi:SAM-dependent methyltransferase
MEAPEAHRIPRPPGPVSPSAPRPLVGDGLFHAHIPCLPSDLPLDADPIAIKEQNEYECSTKSQGAMKLSQLRESGVDSMEENPGGNLGDVYAPTFPSLTALVEYLQVWAGNLYTNYGHFSPDVKDEVTVDLGCGYGYLTATLSPIVRWIDGLDVDRDAVTFANQNLLPLLARRNVRFFPYDGKSLPVQTGVYDSVLSFEVIEHVRDPIGYLTQASRLLKPGGRIFLSTPNGLIANKDQTIIRYHSREHLKEYLPEELEALLNRAGFGVRRWFAKVNVRDASFRTPYRNLYSRAVVCSVATIKAHDRSYRAAVLLAGILRHAGLQRRDSWQDYVIEEVARNQIRSDNCETILLEARKTG